MGEFLFLTAVATTYMDDWTADDDYEHQDYYNEGAWSIVAFVDGILWFAVARCIFYFVQSGQHAKWEAKFVCDNNNNSSNNANDNDAISVLSEVPSIVNNV